MKDLNCIYYDSSKKVLIDNSKDSFLFQPDYGVLCKTFIDDDRDVELKKLEKFLLSIKKESDVTEKIKKWNQQYII